MDNPNLSSPASVERSVELSVVRDMLPAAYRKLVERSGLDDESEHEHQLEAVRQSLVIRRGNSIYTYGFIGGLNERCGQLEYQLDEQIMEEYGFDELTEDERLGLLVQLRAAEPEEVGLDTEYYIGVLTGELETSDRHVMIRETVNEYMVDSTKDTLSAKRVVNVCIDGNLIDSFAIGQHHVDAYYQEDTNDIDLEIAKFEAIVGQFNVVGEDEKQAVPMVGPEEIETVRTIISRLGLS